MMRISIDNETSEIEANSLNPAELIQSVMAKVPRDRLVTEILWGGKEFDPANAFDMIEQVVSEIEIHTVSKERWAAMGLDTIISSSKQLKVSFSKAVDLSYEANTAPALRLFGQCIDGLKKLLQGIELTRVAMDLDFSMLRFQGVSMSKLQADLSRICSTLVLAHEKNEIDALCEKADFELVTQLSNWQTFLTHLQNSRPK